MRVSIAIPDAAEYPLGAVRAGLQNIGHEVVDSMTGDLLVTWTPWMGSYRDKIMRMFEARGCPVVVMENGWLSPIGGRKYFQVAYEGWNGTGRYPGAAASRWDSWGLHLASWEEGGRHELVIGQRGHPYDKRTSTKHWHEEVQINSDLEVIRRARDCKVLLADHLAGARCCHVWSSNVASWAVVCGVPVVQHSPRPYLMVHDLASLAGLELRRPDREPILRRLAWAQWNEAELTAGEPFARLLAWDGR